MVRGVPSSAHRRRRKGLNSGLFSGTDEVIEKFTRKKPMSSDEFIGQKPFPLQL